MCAILDSLSALELILERDKSGVNDWHHRTHTPLHTAAVNDHDECIRILVLQVSRSLARDPWMSCGWGL